MKIIAIAILAILLFSIAGCSSLAPLANSLTGNTQQPTPAIIPTTDAPITTIATNPTDSEIYISEGGLTVFSAEVNCANVEAGNSGSYVVYFTNSSGTDITLKPHFVMPTSLRDGYTYIGDKAVGWVDLADTVIVPANSHAETRIRFAIPSDANLPNGNLEFWIGYDYNTGGFLNYSIDQRWLLARG